MDIGREIAVEDEDVGPVHREGQDALPTVDDADAITGAPQQRLERRAHVVVLGDDQDACRRHPSGGACQSQPPRVAVARSTSSIPRRRATSRLFWSP